MRRNDENTNAIVQANHSDLQKLKLMVDQMFSKVANIEYHVLKSNFQKSMGGPDLSEFFPVERAEQIDQFMDRDHPEWPARRDAFYNLLHTCVTEAKSCMARGLFTTLFTRKYMWTVKWPSTG